MPARLAAAIGEVGLDRAKGDQEGERQRKRDAEWIPGRERRRKDQGKDGHMNRRGDAEGEQRERHA